MDVLVNRVIAIFAVLSTFFVISIAGLYLGYFLYVGVAFMPFFLASDFSSQAVILAPALGFITLSLLLAAQYIFQSYAADAEVTRKWLNRIVVGGFALMIVLLTVIFEFAKEGSIDLTNILTAAAAAALIYGVHAFYEESVLKSPTPLEQVWGYLLIVAPLAGVLVAAGAQWAQYDVQRPAKFCVTTDKDSFAATILRASSEGILFTRDSHLVEFRSAGAVKAIVSADNGRCER
jgi:hypothetical protein